MEISIDAFITEMEVKLGKIYTDEQREFIRDINTPTFVFADPGTGKTQSAVGALITAELAHKVPGDTIYALSFTNKATSELEVRHKLACQKLGIKQRVKFQTLHKLCSDILAENFHYLDIDNYSVGSSLSGEKLHNLILGTAEEYNINLHEEKVRDFLYAMRKLNTTLTFDEEHVTKTMEFQNIGIDFESFTRLRSMLYDFHKQLGKIEVGDILIYTLELLQRNPDLRDRLRRRCNLMLVDEAQDLSLLQLGLVDSMTSCPVLIGDQKQQIYGFQGACPEIRREFFRLHPGARDLKLTKSFRCKQAIADFATPLILQNNVGGEDFKGNSEGGIVQLCEGVDTCTIVEGIKKDYENNDRHFPKDILFLYRNNYSGMPLIEELYKQGVPFRSYKYPGAGNIPFVKEMCQVVDFVRSPKTPGLDGALRYLIPEFKATTGITPLMQVANQLKCSPFEVNYAFKNEGVGNRAMMILTEVEEMLRKGDLLSNIFNLIWMLMYETYGREKEKYTDKPAKYYLSLAAPVVRGKTYDQFIHDEQDKMKKLDQFEKLREGVRCYTMHASKGLEADIVHIIDADEDIIPNTRILDRMIKRNCYEDAAKEVRNERSLVYVACTRAREELYIYHSVGSKLSSLFDPLDDSYKKLDIIYENQIMSYNDIDAFKEFTKRGGA